MERLKLTQWDLVWVDLKDAHGHIQGNAKNGNYRLCVVVGNNKECFFSPTSLVIPLTTSTTKHRLPTHCEVSKGISLCEQERVVNKYQIKGKVVGHLTDEEISKMKKSIFAKYGF